MNLLIAKKPVSHPPLLGQPRQEPPRWLSSHQDAVITVCLGLALVWSYWPILRTMIERFWNDPQYSHGFLVPFFSLYLLWHRRDQWRGRTPEASIWGLPLLAGGVAMRLYASRMEVESIDAFSLLPTLAGVVALVGGWQMLRWSWPSIAFLAFMMPPPFRVEHALSMPLRRLATVMSTFLLETCGCPAVADGNIIYLDEVPLKVAEACSGLGMLVTFFTLSTALAILTKRGWVEKMGIVLSALPIAVLANVLRITATGLAHVYLGAQAAHLIMHDLAGWLMMPLALAMLWLYVTLVDLVLPKVAAPPPLMIPGLGK